jgi:heme-degrading monooxygenase HmoA
MYAQVTSIQVPMDKMGELRQMIESHYLPTVCTRPGFLAAYLLEQIDDSSHAQLIQFWEKQADVENWHRTGLLEASVQSIAASIPGVRIQRDGYMVRVAMRSPAKQHAEQTN